MKAILKMNLACGWVLLLGAFAGAQQAKPAIKSYVLKAARLFDGKKRYVEHAGIGRGC